MTPALTASSSSRSPLATRCQVPTALVAARQPELQLLGLPLAHKLGKILGQVDRLGHFGMLLAQLGELRCLVPGTLLRSPHD